VKNAVVVATMVLLCVFCASGPCFAQRSGRIAFVTTRDGAPEIYIMDSDGANQRRLTFDLRKKAEPAWSPDGALISYHVEDSNGNVGIHVIYTDGENHRQLTNLYDRGAVWSPDEHTIAFYRWEDDNWEIYTMNNKGGELSNISRHPLTDTYPTWSPDGRFLAFHTQRDGNWEIYIMNADGTGQRRLTDNDARDWVPAWAPDGKRIAFWSDRDGSWQIYTMFIDGSQQQRITSEPENSPQEITHEISRPAWSPESDALAFVSVRDRNEEIYVMDIDGTNQRRLTFTDAREYDPAWSPY
jgi:Tol biopolymer transport system component